MPSNGTAGRRGRARQLLFLSTPRLWPAWPFLPLVRRRPGCEEELGLLYDGLGAGGLTGLSSTVFICNLFELPRTLPEFLALPKEVYDTAEAVYEALWRVD